MNTFIKTVSKKSGMGFKEKKEYIKKLVNKIPSEKKNILIIPPDISRKHSSIGVLTNILYKALKNKDKVDIMPALGTHDPMNEKQIKDMFGDDIPYERFVVHDWKKDTVQIGEVPSDFVGEITNNKFNESIPVKINKHLVSGVYDLVISLGQVVPHEVVGMANYTKNIAVGVGGFEIISNSHYVGALAGVENVMGNANTSVRKIFDYIEDNLLNNIPLLYILTVNTTETSKETGLTNIVSILSGKNRDIFEKAVELSQKINIIKVEKLFKKIIVYLDPEEFKTTWLGGKGIYRTRKALADGGEIILIAPGLKKFGEDPDNDKLISKYGYVGTDKVVQLVEQDQKLKNNLAAAAHMIQGSSEGRFEITVACKELSKKEIEGVNFNYLPLDKALKKYDINELNPGANIVDNEEIFYVDNPATGLWVYKI